MSDNFVRHAEFPLEPIHHAGIARRIEDLKKKVSDLKRGQKGRPGEGKPREPYPTDRTTVFNRLPRGSDDEKA
jgi:hypothetical protein